MTALTEEFPDPERRVRDFLAGMVAEFPPDFAGVVVSVGLPGDWTPGDAPRLAVTCDYEHETHAWARPGAVLQRATIRVVAWADTPTRVKRLARVAHAAMLRYPATPNTGVSATVDPGNRAPIAYFTVQVAHKPLAQ